MLLSFRYKNIFPVCSRDHFKAAEVPHKVKKRKRYEEKEKRNRRKQKQKIHNCHWHLTSLVNTVQHIYFEIKLSKIQQAKIVFMVKPETLLNGITYYSLACFLYIYNAKT